MNNLDIGEILMTGAIPTILAIGLVFYLIYARKKYFFYFALLLVMVLVLVGLCCLFGPVFVFAALFTSFWGIFLGIPAILEYLSCRKREKIITVSDFAKNADIECEDKFAFENVSRVLDEETELDPRNGQSDFYLDNIWREEYKAPNICDLVPCEIAGNKFYLIERIITRIEHGKYGKIYNVSSGEFICIIPNYKQIELPKFVIRDNIPLLDPVNRLLFPKKYVSFPNNSNFSENFIIEGKPAYKIKSLFSEKVLAAFPNCKIEGIVIKPLGDCLVIKIPRISSALDIMSVILIGFSILNLENDKFVASTVKLKIAEEKKPLSLSEYLSDGSGGLHIPAFLGGFIIIVGVVIIILITCKMRGVF